MKLLEDVIEVHEKLKQTDHSTYLIARALQAADNYIKGIPVSLWPTREQVNDSERRLKEYLTALEKLNG